MEHSETSPRASPSGRKASFVSLDEENGADRNNEEEEMSSTIGKKILRSGYLERLDTTSNDSRVDFVELTIDRELLFYDRDHNPTGMIDLKKAILDVSRQQHLMFQFRHNVNGKEETILLRAASAEEFRKWLVKIKPAAPKPPPAASIAPNLEDNPEKAATLAEIKEEEIVTNCSGYIRLVWTGILIFVPVLSYIITWGAAPFPVYQDSENFDCYLYSTCDDGDGGSGCCPSTESQIWIILFLIHCCWSLLTFGLMFTKANRFGRLYMNMHSSLSSVAAFFVLVVDVVYAFVAQPTMESDWQGAFHPTLQAGPYLFLFSINLHVMSIVTYSALILPNAFLKNDYENKLTFRFFVCGFFCCCSWFWNAIRIPRSTDFRSRLLSVISTLFMVVLSTVLCFFSWQIMYFISCVFSGNYCDSY